MPISAPDAHGPGIRLPPPVLVAGLCALGWALARWAPLGFVPAAPGFGAVVLGAGVLLAAATVVTMMQAGTNPRPDKPDAALVERGPFRFCRNPIYLGFVLVAAGFALRCGDVWPWLAAIGSFAWLHWQVVHREEPYLRARFDADYEAYAARVGRWV